MHACSVWVRPSFVHLAGCRLSLLKAEIHSMPVRSSESFLMCPAIAAHYSDNRSRKLYVFRRCFLPFRWLSFESKLYQTKQTLGLHSVLIRPEDQGPDFDAFSRLRIIKASVIFESCMRGEAGAPVASKGRALKSRTSSVQVSRLLNSSCSVCG
jgi:hypothetical protein